ncbi:MAG: anti-sigma factor family protein [Acidimicrobiales bacterium]
MAHEDPRLASYLERDLGPAEVEALEAHLVDCDGCWQAVIAVRRGRALAEGLREMAPAQLRDRVRMEVGTGPAPRGRARLGAGRLSAALAVAVLSLLGAVLWTSSGSDVGDPVSVAAVVRAADDLVLPASVTAEGREIVLTRQMLDGRPVTVARADASFDMPPGGRSMGDGPNAPWVAHRASMTVVCLSVPENVLVVADLPADRLVEWVRAGGAARPA